MAPGTANSKRGSQWNSRVESWASVREALLLILRRERQGEAGPARATASLCHSQLPAVPTPGAQARQTVLLSQGLLELKQACPAFDDLPHHETGRG